MSKEEVITILKKNIIPIILLSWITAFVSMVAVKYFDVLPKTYVVQSQLVVNPKITDKEDSVKSMDLLKYNENYSLLVYSYTFLDKVLKEFNNEQFKDPLKLKPKIKVLYSSTSQVLTLQVSLNNEKDGIKLSNIMLEELHKEGNKQFTHSDLTVLSQAVTVDKLSYSASLISITLGLVFFVIYLTTMLVYKNEQSKRYKRKQKRKRRS